MNTNVRKILLNIFVFSILIGGFLYSYINSNNTAIAGDLRLCVKGANMSSLDFTQYLTIEYPEYSCPTGYIMMPANFNLNLLQYPTSTNILGNDNNSNGNGATSSTSTNGGQTNPGSTNNPYSDLYNDLTNSNNNNGNTVNTGSGNNNSNNSGNNTGNNNYGDGLFDQLDNLNGGSNFGNSDFNNGNLNGGSNFGNSDLNNGNLNGGSNFGNSDFNNGNLNGGGNFGNGNGNNGSNDLYQVNPNPVIQVDPTLANGRFETLDPNDYKYCVLLTRNMSVGATDANTGREVSALQMYLYDRGYLDIPVSGNYDQNTALAVAKFQYRNQIEVSGIVKADLRSILKELTCIKYPVISYVAKPISPAPITVKVTTGSNNSNSNTTPKTNPPKTNTSSKPVVIIPPTTNVKPDIPNASSMGNLSAIEGNMYLSKGNILYFTYNTRSTKPFICLSLNNTDCTNNNNYAPITEGIMMSLYETVNFSNF